MRTILLLALAASELCAGEVWKRYFAHDAVEDAHGVIAPWYKGQNGQFDFRVRVAAETLKRYPWVGPPRTPSPAPEYVFNTRWKIAPDGAITIPPMDDWTNGDFAQNAARTISALVDYYRYSGDAAALALMTVIGDVTLGRCQTPADHPWPRFLISVPVKGKPYGDCNVAGWMQLDITAELGVALLDGYQVTGNRKWLDAVKHWADVLDAKRNRARGATPWLRYANPEQVRWGNLRSGNVQTGGVVYQLVMLDRLIRLGFPQYREARDQARAYLRDQLLPNWLANDAWGRNYWDWEDPVQAQTTSDWVARYLLDNKETFPNWKNDVRNILGLFLNHTSVDPKSKGEAYSGAWAFPESLSCCGSSLAWGPMEFALVLAQYGVEAESEWARELARRMQILATYEGRETGVAEDNIDGGTIAAGNWFKATHPSALEWILKTMAWLPDIMGANRENHIVRSTAVVRAVSYRRGRIAYSTFDSPEGTYEVLRLAFRPARVSACGKPVSPQVKSLPGGDHLVTVSHAGCTGVVVEGDDPQEERAAGQATEFTFTGNQVRLLGRVGPGGGRVDVHLDGVKQLCGVDFWNPRELDGQVVYYRSGLGGGSHTLRLVPVSTNPLSQGDRTVVEWIQSSAATGDSGFGSGGGPGDAQRMIFGYPYREDYIDSEGSAWRPATEFVTRLGKSADSVAKTWWTLRQAVRIEGTRDPDLYQYGVHAPEIIVNVTVGPGSYDLRLRFAETQYAVAGKRAMGVQFNGRTLIERLDIFESAGNKANRTFDLYYPRVEPRNGLVELRLTGKDGAEAMIQALEVMPSRPR
ncbi:MAG: malectin domain-containing carbohydrate-binding protein [Bryobacteraceae bacterium]